MRPTRRPVAEKAWGRALGKPIAYAGDDLDAWEQQARSIIPPYLVFDFRLMYTFSPYQGFRATPAGLEQTNRLLGHAPRSFEIFAKETAKTWQG